MCVHNSENPSPLSTNVHFSQTPLPHWWVCVRLLLTPSIKCVLFPWRLASGYPVYPIWSYHIFHVNFSKCCPKLNFFFKYHFLYVINSGSIRLILKVFRIGYQTAVWKLFKIRQIFIFYKKWLLRYPCKS